MDTIYAPNSTGKKYFRNRDARAGRGRIGEWKEKVFGYGSGRQWVHITDKK